MPPLPISPNGTHSATCRETSIPASDNCAARKRLRQDSSDSSTSSSSTCSYDNKRGQCELDRRLCSVLSHPLGLPLVCAFYGQDPGKLAYLAQTSDYFSSTGTSTNACDDILKTAFKKWPTIAKNNRKKKEAILTTILTEGISDAHGQDKIPLHAKNEVQWTEQGEPRGETGIVLYHDDDRPSRPLLLLEVCLKGDYWWMIFRQGVEDIQMMYCMANQQTDISPLLLAIMSIDDKPQRSMETTKNTTTTDDDQSFVVKLGVFLCFWENEDSRDNDSLCVSLLWQSKTHNLEDASKAFGRLLRGVCDFSSWITKQDDNDDENEVQYEYFSSNCCRVNDKVRSRLHLLILVCC